MFKEGEIVKSNTRTDKYPLFLMVLFEDREETELEKEFKLNRFKAVVLYDEVEESQGRVSNVWNTSNFVKSSWSELKNYI